MDTPQELINRLMVLERKVGDQETALNTSVKAIQTLQEVAPAIPASIHSNFVRNGEFDMSRNAYLYPIDVTGTPGVDANVSRECFGWYVTPKDTAVHSTGSVSATILTLDTPDFVLGDAGLEIVIEGAGTAGADHDTTIATFTDSTHVVLILAVVTPVTSARIRWRLLTLKDDSTDDDIDATPATNTTLKNSAHTLYGTTLNDPDWDSENGWFRIGSDNWLCQPLKQNLIRPSLQYITSFIFKLAAQIDGSDLHRVNIFLGIWDNSPGQRKFLEGEAIALNATVEGSPSSVASTTYFVVFYTNWGASIGTSQVTVNAPITFTDSQYVALSWDQPIGIIRSEVYRKRGSEVRLIWAPYPQSSYKDKGAIHSTEIFTAFPTTDRTRAVAYMETTRFNFPLATTLRWIKDTQLNIPIPKDYNAAKTTDRQWFVMGLVESVKDATNAVVPRALLVDRVSLSDKPGEFARSAWDSEALRQVTSTPHSGDIGGLGGGPSGGGGTDPGGTNFCPTFEMGIKVKRLDLDGWVDNVQAIDLVDNEEYFRVINKNGQAVEYTATVSPKPQICYEMKTEYEMYQTLRASEDEPVFIDEHGTTICLKNIKAGDIVWGIEGPRTVVSNLRLLKKRHTVKISLEGTEKGFFANGFAIHNEKPDQIFG